MSITLNKTIKNLKREVSSDKLRLSVMEKFLSHDNEVLNETKDDEIKKLILEVKKNEIAEKKEEIEKAEKLIGWLEELQERREKDEKYCMPEIEKLKVTDEQVSNYFFRKE